MKLLLLLLVFVSTCFNIKATSVQQNDIKIYTPFTIKYFRMKNCYKKAEDLNFQNVTLRTNNHNLILSGVMIANVDLDAPIKVDVQLKRKFLGIWWPIPCVNNIGSCSYYDACQFGMSSNEDCPDQFDRCGFPCRCPISKGTYTLTQTQGLKFAKPSSLATWKSGLYGGQVTVKKRNKEIGCYKIGFQVFD